MKKTGRLWLLTTGVLLLAWTVWFRSADRLVVEDPLGHPTMPFGLRDHVKLAREWGPFDRGSLRLACTSTSELRLVLQTLMPMRHLRPARRSLSIKDYEASLHVPGNFDAVLFINGQTSHSLELPQTLFASIRSVDTIVSAPLSADETEGLADWMDETWRKRFGFQALDQGVYMYGFARGDEIRTLVDRCAEPSPVDGE